MFHPGPYGVYETRDGHLVLSMSPLRVLQEALDLPALAPYAAVPYNFAQREEIARLLEPVMQTRTTAEWVVALVPKGVWAAPVFTHAQTFADPAVQAADVVEEIEHPVAGPVRLLRFPLEFSTGRAEVRRPPPLPGEHTDEILRELGYGDADIRRVRAEGAV
jgi:crotonobetainyl-CoA:carnitine CoA-transferase CaiB-like acyl-CoA transferase